MKLDYHMHFEYGSYDIEWVREFWKFARQNGLDEFGASEHSHTFVEFKSLYEEDLILDESKVGNFQKSWLSRNKFKYSLDDYASFIKKLRENNFPIKMGIEVCNFQNQDEVSKILAQYEFDYIIGSVHFLDGWGYDASAIKDEWDNHQLEDLYEIYTKEVEKIAKSQIYDILGHPFNIRLFKHFPDFDTSPYLHRVAKALRNSNMAIDINTGTFYRYPIAEISPYPEFMKVAREYNLPIITSSDAHKPEDCGRYIDEAISYAKSFGYNSCLQFDKRKRREVALDS